MNTAVDIELIKTKVQELICHAAVTRIADHARQENIELVGDIRPAKVGQVLGNWMTIILVTGEALRITLKFHFSLAEAQALSHRVYGLPSADKVSEGKAIDFIKELANLTAGFIVQTCESREIPMGISLPLCTRGFYEVFADYADADYPLLRFSDLWCLEHEGQKIYGTALIEISDVAKLAPLSNFDPSQSDAEEDSEFDFL